MTSEQLRRLAIGLGVLVVVWAGLVFLRRSGADQVEAFSSTDFNPAAVTEVAVTRALDTVRLIRQGSAWTVNGFPADSIRVAQLLSILADSTAGGDLAAESPGSHARLGLDSANARRLTVRTGDRIALNYLVGNRGPGYESVYLRRAGEDRAWLVQSGLAEAAGRSVDDWRDRRILVLASDSIGAVEITHGRSSFTLSRTDSVWVLGSAPADSAAVARLLGQLAGLTATGFPAAAEADSADFARPDRAIRIAGRNGMSLARLVMDSTAGGFLVRQEGQATIFRIDSWTADQLTPSAASLRR